MSHRVAICLGKDVCEGWEGLVSEATGIPATRIDKVIDTESHSVQDFEINGYLCSNCAIESGMDVVKEDVLNVLNPKNGY